jgi:hypothetical protein
MSRLLCFIVSEAPVKGAFFIYPYCGTVNLYQKNSPETLYGTSILPSFLYRSFITPISFYRHCYIETI